MSSMRTGRQESEAAAGNSSARRAPRAAAISALVAILLTGCAPLLGGSKQPTTIYAPAAQVQPSPDWPSVRWHLTVGRPFGARNAESLRIAVRPISNELQVYKGAQWAKSPGDMLEDTVLHALEDSGRIAVVARQGTGVGSDYRLLMDVRRFESDYAGAGVPTATIEVTAKLLHMGDQQLAGSRTFLQTRTARSTAVPDVVDAFEQALVAVGGDLAGWTLTTGEAYERTR
jgi:cholesterol transport system auxiliary component